MLSFLDAFSGYHQIPMYSSDAEKAAFITPHGLFCCNVMPFGLKNVGATNQRLVTKMFRLLLGKTMEVYIDNMLVKSKERLNHATHLPYFCIKISNYIRTIGHQNGLKIDEFSTHQIPPNLKFLLVLKQLNFILRTFFCSLLQSFLIPPIDLK